MDCVHLVRKSHGVLLCERRVESKLRHHQPTPSASPDLLRMGYVGSAELDLHLVASIINTASPTSTSFIEVFKAYNDVLQACGLDPADDVV